jgi:hypothetical protein
MLRKARVKPLYLPRRRRQTNCCNELERVRVLVERGSGVADGLVHPVLVNCDERKAAEGFGDNLWRSLIE